MSQTNKTMVDKEYDEDDCIAYIRQANPESEGIRNLSDDDITYLIDLIYEYMDSRDLIPDEEEEIDEDDEFEVDVDDIYDYVSKNIKRDEMNIEISSEDFLNLYDSEVEYSESLL